MKYVSIKDLENAKVPCLELGCDVVPFVLIQKMSQIDVDASDEEVANNWN